MKATLKQTLLYSGILVCAVITFSLSGWLSFGIFQDTSYRMVTYTTTVVEMSWYTKTEFGPSYPGYTEITRTYVTSQLMNVQTREVPPEAARRALAAETLPAVAATPTTTTTSPKDKSVRGDMWPNEARQPGVAGPAPTGLAARVHAERPAVTPRPTGVPAVPADNPVRRGRDASVRRHKLFKRRRGGGSSSGYGGGGGMDVNWNIGLGRLILFGWTAAVWGYMIIIFIVRGVKPSSQFVSVLANTWMLGLIGLFGAFATINGTVTTATYYEDYPEDYYGHKTPSIVALLFSWILEILIIATVIWEFIWMRKNNNRNLRESITTVERRKLGITPTSPAGSPSSLPYKLDTSGTATPTPPPPAMYFQPVAPGSQPPPGVMYYVPVPAPPGDQGVGQPVYGTPQQPGSQSPYLQPIPAGQQPQFTVQPSMNAQQQFHKPGMEGTQQPQYHYQLQPGAEGTQQPYYVVSGQPQPPMQQQVYPMPAAPQPPTKP